MITARWRRWFLREPYITCDRCRCPVPESVYGPDDPFTMGYYHIDPNWTAFANAGEDHICDECMWDDPRYIAVYGVMAV